MLENQHSVSLEAIMSDMVRIGAYELLEKKKEGYEEDSKQLDIESGLTSIRHGIELPMRLY